VTLVEWKQWWFLATTISCCSCYACVCVCVCPILRMPWRSTEVDVHVYRVHVVVAHPHPALSKARVFSWVDARPHLSYVLSRRGLLQWGHFSSALAPSRPCYATRALVAISCAMILSNFNVVVFYPALIHPKVGVMLVMCKCTMDRAKCEEMVIQHPLDSASDNLAAP